MRKKTKKPRIIWGDLAILLNELLPLGHPIQKPGYFWGWTRDEFIAALKKMEKHKILNLPRYEIREIPKRGRKK